MIEMKIEINMKSKYLQIHRMPSGYWSIGIGISSDGWLNPRQTYLYINLYKWSVYLGNLANI